MHTIRIFNANPKYSIRHAPTITLVRRVLSGEGIQNAFIGVIFIGDRKMKTMNGLYLNHRYTTDVLSFPLSETHGVIDGEVYVNLDQALRQANDYRVTIHEERKRLIVHGVLHLAGYQDKTKKEQLRMRALEDGYLAEEKG